MRRDFMGPLVAAVVAVASVVAGEAPAQAATSDTLVMGQSLSEDASIVAKNGKYRAVLQKSDGNFVVYTMADNKVVWAANPSGGAAGWTLKLQTDGNLVIYDPVNVARWATNTYESGATSYFLRMEDSGALNLYKGTVAAPVGVLWSSTTGRRFKYVSDADIARAFRPQFRFAKNTRCWGLAFSESWHTKDECKPDYDPNFAVLAHVSRPADGAAAATDGNTFRISYGIAFGYQQGSFSSTIQAVANDLKEDVGQHGEDAQYLVVDVVDGVVTSVWADLHSGYYARARGELSMLDDRRVIAWVGPYYHPFKLVRETTSMCKSESEGAYGLTPNITHDGLRTLCLGTCGSARSCGSTDKVLNFGDPSGETYLADGQLVMAKDACDAVENYRAPDGLTYSWKKGSKYDLYALKGYLGCTVPSEVPVWDKAYTRNGIYTDAYGLKGCKSGKIKAGDICNATHFGEDKKWLTSRAPNRMTIDPTVAGSADPDYRAGDVFNDLEWINGRPRSITFRTGARVDAVSTSYTDGGVQGHGGSGGSATTMDGLENDPIVRVELCSRTRDGKVRVGHIKLKTYSGVMKQGGDGYDNCRTIAPYGKMLYGFYGRSGGELDLLGTIWGDLPASLPVKPNWW